MILAGVAAVIFLAVACGYAILWYCVLIVMLIAGASVLLWMFMGGEGGEGGESEARQIEKIFQFQIVDKQEHAEPYHWFHVKHWESPYFLEMTTSSSSRDSASVHNPSTVARVSASRSWITCPDRASSS